VNLPLYAVELRQLPPYQLLRSLQGLQEDILAGKPSTTDSTPKGALWGCLEEKPQMVPSAGARPQGRTRRPPHVGRVSRGGVSTSSSSYCKLHQRHAANSISVTVRAGTPLSWGSRAEPRTRQRYALRRTCYALRRTCSERNSVPAHSPSEGDTRDHTRVVLLQLRLAVQALLQW
jgi:hypothetical protein